MQVWTISNQKGGVGKTTSVVTIGGLLAAEGRRVLLVDLDPHGSLTSYFQHNPDKLANSVYQLFFENRCRDRDYIRSILKPTTMKNVQILPASTSLATLERSVSAQDGMGLVIARSLQQLDGDYDIALLDTSPTLGALLVNALAACQQLVIPTQTEFLALKGLERMVRTVQMVTHSQERQLPFLVVPTLFDRRTSAAMSTLKILRQTYRDALWDEAIPVDTRLRDASHAGVFPHQMAANSRSVRSYRHLTSVLEMLENSYA